MYLEIVFVRYVCIFGLILYINDIAIVLDLEYNIIIEHMR